MFSALTTDTTDSPRFIFRAPGLSDVSSSLSASSLKQRVTNWHRRNLKSLRRMFNCLRHKSYSLEWYPLSRSYVICGVFSDKTVHTSTEHMLEWYHSSPSSILYQAFFHSPHSVFVHSVNMSIYDKARSWICVLSTLIMSWKSIFLIPDHSFLVPKHNYYLPFRCCAWQQPIFLYTYYMLIFFWSILIFLTRRAPLQKLHRYLWPTSSVQTWFQRVELIFFWGGHVGYPEA